jgi:hypothetical protein
MRSVALFVSAFVLATLSTWAVWKASELQNLSERRGAMVLQEEVSDVSFVQPQAIKKTIKTPLSCEEINWRAMGSGEKVPKNEYLMDAEIDGGRYDPTVPLEYFLELVDDEFEMRIEEFLGESDGCDLSRIDVESSSRDHNIENSQVFAERQWKEFRKFECAYFAMLDSDTLLCEPKIMARDQLMECDRKFREFIIEDEIEIVRLALEVSLAQVNELASNWPLHKRLGCLNEEIADQRELLMEFLDVYEEYPSAFINASQSK